jgi:hydrogenase/urease accessory protein HupE
VRAPAVAGEETPSRIDAASFLAWGVEHVLTGWDHLAFLLTLLVVARGVRDAVRVATAFTVAHSVTLSLAAFDVVRLPGPPVEVAIALSIVVAAAMNLRSPASGARMAVAFGFGLVHGLGFSSALGDLLGGAVGSRALAVAAFNGGVEAGQAAAVLVALPILLAWRRRAPAGYARLGLRGLSLAAGAAGLVWLASRAAELA